MQHSRRAEGDGREHFEELGAASKERAKKCIDKVWDIMSRASADMVEALCLAQIDKTAQESARVKERDLLDYEVEAITKISLMTMESMREVISMSSEVARMAMITRLRGSVPKMGGLSTKEEQEALTNIVLSDSALRNDLRHAGVVACREATVACIAAIRDCHRVAPSGGEMDERFDNRYETMGYESKEAWLKKFTEISAPIQNDLGSQGQRDAGSDD